MEEFQRQHITRNLSKLLQNTVFSSTCIAILKESHVFGDDDVAHLEAIANEREKVMKFYDLVMKKDDSYRHLLTALEESLQTGALAILNEIYQTTTSNFGLKNPMSKNSIRFDVLPPVRLFTGREFELQQVHEKLQRSQTKLAVVSQLASIVGLGGIGKTELARRYIEKYSQDYDSNFIWISAQTEESMTECFRRLALDFLKLSSLNANGHEKAITTIVDEVYNYFQGQSCLFIFDNAESTEHLQKFMPFRVTMRPYILMTSRDKEWAFSAEVVALDEMAEQDAVNFVKKGLQIENDGEQDVVLDFVRKLQHYPLALSQAISYIKQQQMSGTFGIQDYLQFFNESAEKLLNSSIPKAEFNTYRETTTTTWKMTTEQISSNDEYGACAIQILNMIAYLQPDKIPCKIWAGLGNDYRRALFLLVKYSMINFQPDEDSMSVHRLVQEVTRKEAARCHIEEETLKVTLKLLAENLTTETANHAASACKYSFKYKALTVEFRELPWQIAKLLF